MFIKNEIIKNMDIMEYHRHDGLSNSGLKYILDCPERYYTEYLDPNKPQKETPKHYRIGSAVHTMVLEPEKFSSLYTKDLTMEEIVKHPLLKDVGEDVYRREKGRYDKQKEIQKLQKETFECLSQGKTILSSKEMDQVLGMSESILRRIKWLKPALKNAGIEQSFFWIDDHSGVQLKSRPDAYTEDYYIDLKTTSSIKDFPWNAFKYGYHTQAAMAREAMHKLLGTHYEHFMYVVVEDTYPYLTKTFVLDQESIDKGHEDFKRGALTYKQCKETNEWPGYSDDVQEINLPNRLKL